MAKYWTPGQVKTRLGQSIGDDLAAQVHHRFVLHLAEQLRDVAEDRVFVVAPSDRLAVFQAALPQPCWRVTAQSQGDLGCRIEAWFKQALAAAGNDEVAAVLIGADCPRLDGVAIEQAFQHLPTHDVVLGPAVDGGYYLIGLQGPWRSAYGSLFESIPWSSEAVFEITVARGQEAGLSLTMLPQREDVDTIIQLNRLRQSLSASVPSDQQLAGTLDMILGATP